MTTCWIAPDDVSALARVALDPVDYTYRDDLLPTLETGQNAVAMDAIAVATEVLARLTGFSVHGPGVAIDECAASPLVTRLTPTMSPLRDVTTVQVLDSSDVWQTKTGYRIRGQSIVFGSPSSFGAPSGYHRPGSASSRETIRVQYRFGSTVTRSAREAALYYARQLYLGSPLGDEETCQLPERVTSVTREGISYQMIDPQTFISEGRTGLPRVDSWVVAMNRPKGQRRSGVYTPSSPPMINIGTWCNSEAPAATGNLELWVGV